MQFEKVKPPIWNLWRDGVTQSLITKWLQCPVQCELEYVHGWTPIKTSEALFFGKIIHYVLEHAYAEEQPPLSGNVESFLTGFKDKIEKQNDNLSTEDFEKREIIYAKAAGLLKAYFFYFRDDFNYRWWSLEERFKVNGPSGTGIELNGMIDGAFSKKEKDYNIYLIDHKILSVINVDNCELLLPADFQINFYLYGIRKLLASIDPKFKIKGFYYNIIRRPGLKFTKKDGNLRAYEERIFEDILNRPHHYFCSERNKSASEGAKINESGSRDLFYIPVANEEIDQFEQKQLRPILRDIERWHESKFKWPGYYNPQALETKYGLAPMTRAILYKDFSGLYQRPVPFQELEE